jgi:hypothetical protein
MYGILPKEAVEALKDLLLYKGVTKKQMGAHGNIV